MARAQQLLLGVIFVSAITGAVLTLAQDNRAADDDILDDSIAGRRRLTVSTQRDRMAPLQPSTGGSEEGRLDRVLDVFCINWLRTLPYVRAWADSTSIKAWS
jgi:hypothetical protein